MKVRTAGLLLVSTLWAQALLAFVILQWQEVGIAILSAVIGVLAASFLVPVGYGALFGAPYLPTEASRIGGMLDLAGVREGDTVVDLGAGDGRMLIEAARRGAKAEGWEINPYLWALGQWKIRRAGLQDLAKLRLGSYWGESMAHADVVLLFLITGQMGKMESKLKQELHEGSRVVSHIFTFPTWEADPETRSGMHLYRR